MLPSSYRRAVALSIFALPLARSQIISSLPDCVQDCIDSSQDDNCSAADIECLCRASAGNFLPSLITCIHAQCDNDLDNDLLLTPLQWACDLAGAPLPASAIQNAENQASSLAAQVTTTVTAPASGASASTTTESGSMTTETVTTTQSGSIIVLAYPVTEGSTTTISGSPSTITAVSTESEGSVNSAGSAFTTTQKPSSSSSSGTSVSSSTTVTTSVAAEKASGTQAQTKTSAAPNPDATDSAPFKNTNDGVRMNVGGWFGLSVLLVAGCIWF